MEAKLERIRKQANSKLANQKLYGQTLIAIEETITEQNEALTPTAYFGALMTTLQSSQGSSELIGSLLYILDEVFPFLPHSVLRSKFADIIAILESTFETHKEEQPIVRPILGCLQELLAAQDAPNWSMPVTKKAYQLLLVLSANASPKARKRAQDAVRNILSRPPPPTIVHPAADMTADFVLRVLHETSKSDQHAAQQMLALLQTIVPYWPASKFSTLCQTLLQLPKFNNIFLTKAAFDVFEALFDAQDTDMDADKFASLLRAICELKPAAVDERLLPTWLLIVGKAFPSYAKSNPAQCAHDLSTVFNLVFADFQQDSRCHRQIANCLSTLIDYCVTDDLIDQASAGESNGLVEIIQSLEAGLGVHFQPAWVHVMTVQQAMFNKLNHSAAPLMNGCLALLGELRLSPNESYKEQLDKTLGVAISTMGPEFFLSVLPLNLETPTSSSHIGRAFLLPLLKTYTTNTTLGYFVNVLIPLGDRLAAKGEAAAARDLEMQAKVYETLVNQIWSLAPGFCDLPVDLTRAFNDTVAERFSSLLYTQPELRPTIAQALQLLIEKNQALVKSSADDAHLLRAYGLTKAQAAENLNFMGKFAVNYLAVFFNVYSQIAPQVRGFMAEVIRAYLTVTTTEDINTTFKKVLAMLSQALESNEVAPSNDPSVPPPMSHTMLDLATIMIPFLDLESSGLLYNGTLTQLLAKESDPTLQKKGYKVLNHLMSSPNGRQVVAQDIDNLQNHLLEATVTCTNSAKKDRIKTLNEVVSLLPNTDLHFIPAILSEVVLASKDNNEKTRNFAFDLLVNMGNKMKEGGIVKNSRLDGFDESFPDAQATISEFFTMVTAGLAGTTAHMIGATVGALSRIFFEFKNDLPAEITSELLQTINVLAASNNREIVKAAVGYVKVCIVVLDINILQPQLENIVRSLLKCQQQHRSHFKVKIRHMFERLIRRFGYEAVANLMPEEDRKMIVNIQKRRLRAKRRKGANAHAAESDEEEVGARDTAKKGAFADAYEEVLYGSESEIDDDDSEDETLKTVKAAVTIQKQKQKKRNNNVSNAFIREDGEDGPLDFLDRSALGRISSNKPTQRKTKNNSGAFAEGDDGRLVIAEPKGEQQQEEQAEQGEDYYMQHVTNPDGFTRDKRNRIKFKKGKDAVDDAMEVDDGEEGKKPKKAPQKFERIGKEFRSKRAGGDVKRKGQMDPFSYVPLNKVIKKKGRRDEKVTYTGRVKK
ncbi:NUC173 domain-containing protein [Helicostylum pulchrum]|uniref:Ribosomal RNA-processing protein 12-like conserved domain-containing protein n=1 Tax=Helicostylum pulchrum TaxID=562976 RepID=A0ABP9Y9U5_9FUNG|nr:NUC173 domain-containing protein [Helicostylum pulchrum]